MQRPDRVQVFAGLLVLAGCRGQRAAEEEGAGVVVGAGLQALDRRLTDVLNLLGEGGGIAVLNAVDGDLLDAVADVVAEADDAQAQPVVVSEGLGPVEPDAHFELV